MNSPKHNPAPRSVNVNLSTLLSFSLVSLSVYMLVIYFSVTTLQNTGCLIHTIRYTSILTMLLWSLKSQVFTFDFWNTFTGAVMGWTEDERGNGESIGCVQSDCRNRLSSPALSVKTCNLRNSRSITSPDEINAKPWRGGFRVPGMWLPALGDWWIANGHSCLGIRAIGWYIVCGWDWWLRGTLEDGLKTNNCV